MLVYLNIVLCSGHVSIIVTDGRTIVLNNAKTHTCMLENSAIQVYIYQ
jgi:hypothetical protein